MKKLFAALAAAAMLASLCGCGNVDDGIVTSSPDTKPVPTAITGTHVPQDTGMGTDMPKVTAGNAVTAPPSMSAME